jgi:hypothetical protein
VWRARPYIRWTLDNPQPVRDAYSDLSTKTFMVRLAKQSDGWIITRHAAPGAGRIYAEIRPDSPVFTGPPIRHYHGESPLTNGEVPARHVHSPRNMRFHIARDRFPDDHRGANSPEVHEHRDPAKYVFPPTPKVENWRFHAHAKLKPERLALHLHHDHGGEDTAETHSHVRRVKDPDRDLAKRLDVHPLALPKFAKATTVFFVLEGCIKADAVLSTDAAVFSVPSVTLWDCDELPRFAEHYLRNKTIVIVPDADWANNSLVFTQARLCQTRLRRLGISAHVAAPPASAGLKGVDDFLVNGNLEDLEVLDRQFGKYGLYYGRNDELKRNAEVLVSLAMHADPNGLLCVPLRAIARIMGVHVERVARAIRALELGRAITVEGDLAINKKGWITHNFYSNELDWEERPTIVIAEANRATDLPPVKLRDFLAKLRSETLGDDHAH